MHYQQSDNCNCIQCYLQAGHVYDNRTKQRGCPKDELVWWSQKVSACR